MYMAPKTLLFCTNDNDFFVANIANAGSVFVGNYTPESAGDYAYGTNHALRKRSEPSRSKKI